MKRRISEMNHLEQVERRSFRTKMGRSRTSTCLRLVLVAMALTLIACFTARAQVNSGSTGSDGALDFSTITATTNIVIDMHDHPTGIYNYSYVNIPANVTVTFIPNGNNTPVYWLVQSNCFIAAGATVSVSANPDWNGILSTSSSSSMAQLPGPGGFAGGNGGTAATAGQGLGGGNKGSTNDSTIVGGNGSFATIGGVASFQASSGPMYGNQFLIPLIGGSGGGGNAAGFGGGGGGAILLAASGTLTLNGTISANGSMGGQAHTAYVSYPTGAGGAGSGGAIRLVASHFDGTGSINAQGGYPWEYAGDPINSYGAISQAGSGRIRIDTIDNAFSGTMSGSFTQGYQPIIFPTAAQGTQLTITSVGGVPVSASPSGQIATPDALLSAQQNNPIPVTVSCANLPLDTLITVTVRPVDGSPVSAIGYNNTGTQASSTATISLNMPHGGGIIFATAATGN